MSTGPQDPNARREILARGGRAAGGGIAYGPARNYTFVEADTADPDSWYGNALTKVVLQWTPTKSGTLALSMGTDNGEDDWQAGNFELDLWPGDEANVDYPDGQAASGEFSNDDGDVYVFGPDNLQQAVPIVAGETYTFIATNWNTPENGIGTVFPLDGLYAAIAPFGGLEGLPPAPPVGYAGTLVRSPDGDPVWLLTLDIIRIDD